MRRFFSRLPRPPKELIKEGSYSFYATPKKTNNSAGQHLSLLHVPRYAVFQLVDSRRSGQKRQLLLRGATSSHPTGKPRAARSISLFTRTFYFQVVYV